MGVPAFYRWLSEKYPKIVQDVVEDRVKIVSNDGTIRVPFDSTRPNPSGLEADNLYIDMNGIIHPCSHPENGPQPTCEEEMYENVCRYVDRLFRAVRPRKLLYLAIDGVAPRAKMNQQRSRRFRSAQEAREHAELEEHIRQELIKAGQNIPPIKKAWDSNVITPGTPFMIRLAEYVRFYIRKRMSTDKAWKDILVIFSDASIPGEGEHKIMEHVRLQRCQPGYNPNTVHVLHGLDADLIMLALATHEMHFYILREEVTFGRRSMEQNEQRQLESGYMDAQRLLDEQAGEAAMHLPENKHKPLQRISIPILREYFSSEFASLLQPGRLPFPPSLERLIDDIVFLCFFVGNDFLPHLPSLDIRDGALDFLFNVYKRVLPTFRDYITSHGGQVNLTNVDVILAEVGAIEDYVFAMKHSNEERNRKRQEEIKAQRREGRKPDAPPPVVAPKKTPPRGRAAKILEKQEGVVALGSPKKAKQMVPEANVKAALELKKSLTGKTEEKDVKMEPKEVKSEQIEIKVEMKEVKSEEAENTSLSPAKQEDGVADVPMKKEDEEKPEDAAVSGTKRKLEEVESDSAAKTEADGEEGTETAFVEEAEFDDEVDEEGDGDEVDEEASQEETEEVVELAAEIDPKLAGLFKEKVKAAKSKQLDDFSKNVEDNVRLHEKGWKDRYYKDKCKADDVSAHGGREHMYRSYVVGLCWVMKYYYNGCASWTWFFPFHYAPFASDLRNIERFQKDCNSLELNEPFKPVQQLMGVLPADSARAIPKASRWLMTDNESPIIDFYPEDVPVDPNGKAMPWLWVVLLPFIDEERLLAAMEPTIKDWTKQELLCNTRGLDNGYLYVHTSNSLTEKLSEVLEDPERYKTSKTRVTNSSSYGRGTLSGSVRLPLSNEIHPIDGDTTIKPPSSASKITQVDFDGLLTDPVDPNSAVCFAFTEPPKLSHKSVVLPGAKQCRPVLTSEDRRLRRPRLNRGGATISHMGGSNGRSHQSGYGSMNISSYERDLAARTGRGNQMYQTGTRAWGAMEPMPKRGRQQDYDRQPVYPSNPFGRQAPQPTQQASSRPPWQNGRDSRHPQANYASSQQGLQGRWQPPSNAQGNAQHQFNRQGQVYPNQQGYGGQGNAYQQQGYNPSRGSYGGGHQQRPPPQGYNRSGPGGPPYGQGSSGYGDRSPPYQNQPPSRVNPNVMSDLRSQLASTLNRNSRRGGRNEGGRRY